MIYSLPFFLQIVVLAVLGGCTGAAINYGIYAWTWFLKRNYSPWQAPDPKVTARGWGDRVPVLGWWRLRRERTVHGNWFWLRPFLLELVWVIGLPWFYFWQLRGGLVGGQLVPLPTAWQSTAETWFWLQAILIALMFIATFIDFDERTIPDAVTIPGTLLALLFAAWLPDSRLPEVASNLAGQTISPLSFANGRPHPLFGIQPIWFAEGVQWHQGIAGMWVALIVFWGWVLALMPKRCTLRFGLLKGIWLLFFSVVRPRRKTTCAIRNLQRRPYLETVCLLGLGLVGTIAIAVCKWTLPATNWGSLFQAFFGMGFGGLMIWGIRIIGQWALQKEAMGFGDVTLMAMVGAFLGWQAALMTLPFAVVFALVVTVGMFIFIRDNQLAFGPYLCMGCAVVLFFWYRLWPAMGGYFSLGDWLFYLLGFMLVLVLVMLSALQLMKRLVGLA